MIHDSYPAPRRHSKETKTSTDRTRYSPVCFPLRLARGTVLWLHIFGDANRKKGDSAFFIVIIILKLHHVRK